MEGKEGENPTPTIKFYNPEDKIQLDPNEPDRVFRSREIDTNGLGKAQLIGNSWDNGDIPGDGLMGIVLTENSAEIKPFDKYKDKFSLSVLLQNPPLNQSVRCMCTFRLGEKTYSLESVNTPDDLNDGTLYDFMWWKVLGSKEEEILTLQADMDVKVLSSLNFSFESFQPESTAPTD